MFNLCARYFDASDVHLVVRCCHAGAIGFSWQTIA